MAAVLAAAEGTPGLDSVTLCARRWLSETTDGPDSSGSCVSFDLDADGVIIPDTPYPHGRADPDALYAAAQELRERALATQFHGADAVEGHREEHQR
ncbi:hypothetical protein [Actinomyces qiguomingii]|uniref:hypothetical protein n=1 Tax=Actinomyces qiguomingii TaxID=2057800 RepID=UPI000CA083DB|nr:hypothetical protein [Actinomyces qiguomingii]